MIREEAIAILKGFMDNPLFSDIHKAAFNIAIHDIEEVADYEYVPRMIGKWICDSKGDRYADYHCSLCGRKLNFAYCDIQDYQDDNQYIYCDSCGAKMDREQQGENEQQ